MENHSVVFLPIVAQQNGALSGTKVSSFYLHAFTGCDTVLAFCRIGKKTAWSAWQACEAFGQLYSRSSTPLHQWSDEDMDQLEDFIVLMYKCTLSLKKVNDARIRLFALCNRQLENIPPTRTALIEHAKHAIFQAGHI